MSYIKNVWENGDKVTSEKLNNIENGIEELDNKTKIVEKGFKEFQIGDRFQSGYELTIDNSNGVVPSKTYYFYAYNSNGEYLEAFDLLVSLIKDSPIQFQWGFEAKGENFITNAVIFGADPEDIATFISEIAYYELVDSSSVSGSGLLGGYGETRLTLQDVYDNTKVIDKEFKEFEGGQTFKVGDKITLENAKNPTTKDYMFVFDTTSVQYYMYVRAYEDIIWYTLEDEGGQTFIDTEVPEIFLSFNKIAEQAGEPLIGYGGLVLTDDVINTIHLSDEIVEEEGTGLLGTWTEKQLTAQEVYDKLNTGIGYKTAKVIVDEVDNSYFKINLPEIIDIFNGNLLIKKSNGNILRIVWNDYLKFYVSGYEVENIDLDACSLGDDGTNTPNDITIFIGPNNQFMLAHGEEVELMYFVSPFAQFYEM